MLLYNMNLEILYSQLALLRTYYLPQHSIKYQIVFVNL